MTDRTTATLLRPCICADPENCREPVPGYRCRRGERNQSAIAPPSDTPQPLIERLDRLSKRLMATTEYHPDAHTVLEAGILLLRMQEEMNVLRQSAKEQIANLHATLAVADTNQSATDTGLAVAAKICEDYIERLKLHKNPDGLQTGEDFNVFEITAVEDVLRLILGSMKATASTTVRKCANEGVCECDFPKCQYPGSPCSSPGDGEKT